MNSHTISHPSVVPYSVLSGHFRSYTSGIQWQSHDKSKPNNNISAHHHTLQLTGTSLCCQSISPTTKPAKAATTTEEEKTAWTKKTGRTWKNKCAHSFFASNQMLDSLKFMEKNKNRNIKYHQMTHQNYRNCHPPSHPDPTLAGTLQEFPPISGSFEDIRPNGLCPSVPSP